MALEIENQHTVSKVVLRRFCVDQKMTVYDRERRRCDVKGVRRVFASDFDQVDPSATERDWNTRVEKKMHAVYNLLDEHRALSDPQAVQTLRALLAMHWARSQAALRFHQTMKAPVAAQQLHERARHPALLAEMLRQQTGIIAAGPEALDWINQKMNPEIIEEAGKLAFHDVVADGFDAAMALLEGAALEVGYVEEGAELVIGDAPVITRRPDHPGLGPHQGLGILDAASILMPISPKILIGAARASAEVSISAEAAQMANQYQVHSFVRWIGCRPTGSAEPEIQRLCRTERSRSTSRPSSRLTGTKTYPSETSSLSRRCDAASGVDV